MEIFGALARAVHRFQGDKISEYSNPNNKSMDLWFCTKSKWHVPRSILFWFGPLGGFSLTLCQPFYAHLLMSKLKPAVICHFFDSNQFGSLQSGHAPSPKEPSFSLVQTRILLAGPQCLLHPNHLGWVEELSNEINLWFYLILGASREWLADTYRIENEDPSFGAFVAGHVGK